MCVRVCVQHRKAADQPMQAKLLAACIGHENLDLEVCRTTVSVPPCLAQHGMKHHAPPAQPSTACGAHMADADLQKLRAQVADNIRKIDSTLNRSWWERTRAHLHRNSNALINVTLAGCLMVISFGRLQVWRQLEVGAS